MTTHPSRPTTPTGDATIVHVTTTPIWRLVGTAAAIAGVVAIGHHLALTEMLDEFSVVIGSATAFLVQHVLLRDPRTVTRLAGVWAPLAESILNVRKASARSPLVALIPTAVIYGLVVLCVQKAVLHAGSLFASWWVAGGVGAILISLVVMPEMWKAARDTVVSRSPAPAPENEDDELLALPSRARKVPATRVRFTLPGGEVQAERLEKALTSRGMSDSDVEAFADEFNSRTAGIEGTRVPVVVSIYDDGTFSFTVADEEA